MQRGDAAFVDYGSRGFDLEVPGRLRSSRSIVSLWFRSIQLSPAGTFETEDFANTTCTGGFWLEKNHQLKRVQVTLLNTSEDQWHLTVQATLAEQMSGFTVKLG